MTTWFLLFGPVIGLIFFALMVNLMTSNLGGKNGQHRQSSASLYGGPAQLSGQSAGGSPSPGAYLPIASGGTGSTSIAQAAARHNAMMQAAMNAGPYAQQLAMYQAMQNYAVMRAGPPHQPTDLKSEGVRCGEIIAWRAWHVKEEDLLSVVAEAKPWSATEPMEGDAAAGYGVHAYKGPHGPVLDEYVTRDSSKLWVIGEVAMWGDIIEHEDGYRSQFARVHSLVTWHAKVSPFHRKLICEKYLRQPEYKIDDAA